MNDGRELIGICSAYLEQAFHMRLISRLSYECTKRGYQVVLFGLGSDLYFDTMGDDGEKAVCALIDYDKLDCLVLFPETIKQESVVNRMVDKAHIAGIPVVALEKEWKGCYSVVYDTETAFEELVRHVIEYHGLKEVNFMAGIEGNEMSENRLAIYREVLEDNGILYEEDRVGYGDFWEGPTRIVMDRFMDVHKTPPEAIICANDSMAVAVCDYLEEHDVRVPEDILVTGIDGIDEGIKHSPGITTCVRDEVNDAKRIVEMIEELLAGKKLPNLMELSYHMQLSQSCGCQENYLFNPVTVLSRLSTKLATACSDVKYYADMAQNFLTCKTQDAFWEILTNYLPDDSFLCLNNDLTVEGTLDNTHTIWEKPYTDELSVVAKWKGDVSRLSYKKDELVPVINEASTGFSVILYPVHFGDLVVGYLGIWYDVREEKRDLERILHFLFQFGNSAGVRLRRTEKTQ